MRVAIIGSGVSGLGAAHALAPWAQVSLVEAEARFGGHANTVDVTLDGVTHGVDTGFLVFNHRTYPNLVRLFEALGVATAPSDMSFSVQDRARGLEWSGSDLRSVFAQKRNLASPRFLRMLADIVRFNRAATALALAEADTGMSESVGEFLDRHGFGAAFRESYFLPMVGCIWSCPAEQMLRFPVGTMIRFCHNHGLIQVADRPQWHTVAGGSKHYVQALLDRFRAAGGRAFAGVPVRSVRRVPPGDGRGGVLVATEAGSERFDEVILAAHSDQSLALLHDADAAEREVLGAIRYHPNRAVLHTDASLLPRRPRAWAAWNYDRAANATTEQASVCLHYLIGRLQPLPWKRPVIVTLNPDPARLPADSATIRRFEYSHPVFDAAAVAAQARLPAIQGRSHVWFAGAWARYGFHEDGLASGLEVAERLRSRIAAAPAERAAA
jgi:predicted NAD/FAD-binding protein